MKLDYHHTDYSCLRIPSLSIEALQRLDDDLKLSDLSNKEVLHGMIHKLLSDSLFFEALYTSSPGFLNRIIQSIESEKTDAQALFELLTSIYKYYSRMAHRSTPYGLFAGVFSAKRTTDASVISFSENLLKPKVQFNIQKVSHAIRFWQQHPDQTFESLTFYVNNTLYTIEDRLYYVEKLDKAGEQVSNLASIEINEHLVRILDTAKNGATIHQLVETIQLEGFSHEDKLSYIHGLISSQVLNPSFIPCIGSCNFMGDLTNQLGELQIEAPLLSALSEMNERYRSITSLEDFSTLRQLSDELSQKPQSVDLRDAYKIDLFYNADQAALNIEVQNKIRTIGNELMQLSAVETPADIGEFIQRFHAKYEEREVPLIHALDPNYGVGFGLNVNGVSEFTPLIAGLPIQIEEESRFTYHSKFESIRTACKHQYFSHGKTVVQVDDLFDEWIKERSARATNDNRTHTSVYTFGSLYASSLEELDKGNFKFKVTQANAPYAGKLISRFMHGDENIRHQVRAIAEHEQNVNKETILAEVQYIPDGKYANISLTGPLRTYEIPYSSGSQVSENYQINVNDLLVSVRNGRIILRSKALQKEVIPCLTNTYDARFGSSIYQFLSQVSYQSINHGFEWDWGPSNQEEPFLPRIEYKNFILSPARWFIKKTELNYKSDDVLRHYFTELTNRLKLPERVIVPEGDNELLIDLNNPVGRFLLGKLINQSNTVLHESFKDPENCFIKRNNESFHCEIILPMVTNEPFYRLPATVSTKRTIHETQRIFYPGSEWLYVKIYAGTKILEDLIKAVILPFTSELVEKSVVDKWFFIRYDDPKYHLRIRFHKNKNGNQANEWYHLLENLSALIEQACPTEHAVNIQVDTYQREIERYGDSTMVLSETLFYEDSKSICAFLDLLSGNEGEDYRWRFSLVNIDTLLTALGFTLEGKRTILQDLSHNFFNEFAETSVDRGKALSKDLRSRFRQNVQEIEQYLDYQHIDPDLLEGYQCFFNRSKAIAEIAAELRKVTDEHYFTELVHSYIHMTMNRLFVVNQRRHEMVIYRFLADFYASQLARQTQKTTVYANAPN